MIVHYIVRDVKPGSACSYPVGRTLLNKGPVFDTHKEREAYATAACYNEHCHVSGVTYSVVSHEETEPFPADHYEQ